MRLARNAVAATGLIVAAMGVSSESAAADYAYRNWTRSPGNTAGVVFHPNGDRWDIYDNRRDRYPAFVRFACVGKGGSQGLWKTVGHVTDNHITITCDVAEHRFILFQIFGNFSPSSFSPVARYRTS